MKLFLAVCLLLFSITTSAQTTLDLLQKTMQLFEKGDYEQTIAYGIKAQEAVKKDFGENHTLYNGVNFFLAVSHYRLYHYATAETYFLKQKNFLSKTTGEKDKSYIACLLNLAVLYRDMGKYQQSEALYIQATATTKILLGDKDPGYATNINNLGSLYQFLGQYAKAELLFLEAITILKNSVGENNALYASSLNNLGTLYSEMGLYEKAIPALVRVLEIRKEVLGETNTDYAASLNNLATVNVSMGKYDEAENYYLQTNQIFKKVLGENHPDYAIGLDNLCYFYKTIGKYEKAEKLCLQALNIRKKVYGENNPSFAASLNNLAGLYAATGQYEKAETIYLQSKKIVKSVFGEIHPDYASSLNNLAALYESMGQYKKAEPLYLQCISIKKKILGEVHTGYATSLNNLAILYNMIGNYQKAEILFAKSLEIIKNALGEDNDSYATGLNNIANTWQSAEQYAKAEVAYTRAMEIRKKVFGADHADYAMSLNNLATLYMDMKQYKKAEVLIIQAKDIWKKSPGENSPAYATALNNLAAFYRKTQTQYARSEALYLESIRIRKNVLGENHPFYSESQNDLALLYIQMKEYKKAEPLFLSSSNILLQNIAGTFSILSEKEKAKYLEYNKEMIDCNNSFLYNYPTASASIAENNYNLQLGFKSLSLADTKNMLELVRNSKDTAVKRIFNQWIDNKNILAKQYALSPAGRIGDIKNVEAESESLEKELNRRSAAFNNQQKMLRVTMKDIQKNLAADEAAIEFVRFKLYTKNWTDSVMYGAYILKKNDAAPQFIPLCEKKQLQLLFDSAGSTASKLVNNFYRGMNVKAKEAKLGIKLYKLIWEPLEPCLKGINKISYSPAGKLYSIAFHALPVDSTAILMDKYQLQQYTSTRQIALRSEQNERIKPASIALFGDALFSMDSLELASHSKNNNASYVTTRGNENGAWVSLPGTGEEIKKIGQLFDQNKIASRSFIQEYASEDNLKTMTGKAPQIIHLATHGFFLPDVNKKKTVTVTAGNAYSLSEDPLMRSGLVLAGGNYVWSGKTPVDGVDDGIATAYEISQLNLSNTELLVLSACETALGDIKGTEGVFGLQRGFKMAGIKKMIVSLWQVPDKETAELMTVFYSYWMKGQTINESFYQAQTDMRKKYPAYYWAAFVLVE